MRFGVKFGVLYVIEDAVAQGANRHSDAGRKWWKDMKAVKEILITYLAIWGIILIAPFFMFFIAVSAILARLVFNALGFSDDVVSGAMLASAFLSIWILSNIYSAVRLKKMERDTERYN